MYSSIQLVGTQLIADVERGLGGRAYEGRGLGKIGTDSYSDNCPSLLFETSPNRPARVP